MNKKFIFTLKYTLNDELDKVAVILAKDIPSYKQVGNLVEIPLTEKSFNKYYDRFKFVVDKLLGKNGVVLFHENIEVTGKFLQEFYLAINELKWEDKLKVHNKKKPIPIPPLCDIDNNKVHKIESLSYKLGGVDDIIENLKNTIELPIKTPELLEHLGVQPHKGILLYGESGCGKTLIANTLKEIIGINFVNVNVHDLLNKNCSYTLKDILNNAIEKSPSILYIDELDALAISRDMNNKNNKILIDLLYLFDNINPNNKITILACTNRVDLIDSALLRSGRFDLKIKIDKPNEASCKDIFLKLTNEMSISNKFNKTKFTKKLMGLTGADIEFICREAAYNCIRRNIDLAIPLSVASAKTNNKLLICEEDFNYALNHLR